jgi:hypothetical protein
LSQQPQLIGGQHFQTIYPWEKNVTCQNTETDKELHFRATSEQLKGTENRLKVKSRRRLNLRGEFLGKSTQMCIN